MDLAVKIFLLYMSMNLSCYFLSMSQVYPSQAGLAPNVFASKLDITDILIGGGFIVGGLAISLLFKTFLSPVILIIAGIGYLVTDFGRWVLTGFPSMLGTLGLPSYMVDIAGAISAFAFFLLIIKITTQREL